MHVKSKQLDEVLIRYTLRNVALIFKGLSRKYIDFDVKDDLGFSFLEKAIYFENEICEYVRAENAVAVQSELLGYI